MTLTRPCRCCGGTGKEIDPRGTGDDARRRRKEAGVSLREMAQALNISACYLSDLERGNRNWTPELVERFTRELKKL